MERLGPALQSVFRDAPGLEILLVLVARLDRPVVKRVIEGAGLWIVSATRVLVTYDEAGEAGGPCCHGAGFRE